MLSANMGSSTPDNLCMAQLQQIPYACARCGTLQPDVTRPDMSCCGWGCFTCFMHVVGRVPWSACTCWWCTLVLQVWMQRAHHSHRCDLHFCVELLRTAWQAAPRLWRRLVRHRCVVVASYARLVYAATTREIVHPSWSVHASTAASRRSAALCMCGAAS